MIKVYRSFLHGGFVGRLARYTQWSMLFATSPPTGSGPLPWKAGGSHGVLSRKGWEFVHVSSADSVSDSMSLVASLPA